MSLGRLRSFLLPPVAACCADSCFSSLFELLHHFLRNPPFFHEVALSPDNENKGKWFGAISAGLKQQEMQGEQNHANRMGVGRGAIGVVYRSVCSDLRWQAPCRQRIEIELINPM